jgi:hypothetical protein
MIMEAPWHYAWHENPFPYYQAVHEQRTSIGFVADPDRWSRPGELPRDSRFRFRNAAHVTDIEALVARGVRYAVFHRSLPDETPGDGDRYTPPDISGYLRGYRAAFGEPIYEDVDLVVFEVDEGIDVAGAETTIMRSAYPRWSAARSIIGAGAADERSDVECYVDWVNGELAQSEGNVVGETQLRLTGWAVDHAAAALPEAITVLLTDGRAEYSLEPTRTDRPDVAAYFGNQNYLRSGFDADGPVDAVPPGHYQVLILLTRSGGKLEVCSTDRSIELLR